MALSVEELDAEVDRLSDEVRKAKRELLEGKVKILSWDSLQPRFDGIQGEAEVNHRYDFVNGRFEVSLSIQASSETTQRRNMTEITTAIDGEVIEYVTQVGKQIASLESELNDCYTSLVSSTQANPLNQAPDATSVYLSVQGDRVSYYTIVQKDDKPHLLVANFLYPHPSSDRAVEAELSKQIQENKLQGYELVTTSRTIMQDPKLLQRVVGFHANNLT